MEVTRSPLPLFFDVHDSSHVGEARRGAIALAGACGFGETEAGAVGLVVTELGTNLVRHATDGALVVQRISSPGSDAIETLSIDRGPGMKDVGKCMQDGFTTAGTPGNGLGAVERLSHEFDIFSIPGQGTAILSRVFRHRPVKNREAHVLWAAYCRPAAGETVCGDMWRVDIREDQARFMVCDGLGHGPVAAEAAQAVAQTFDAQPSFGPTQFLDAAHANAMGTRGAAAACAQIQLSSGRVSYAGIGNTSGVLLDGEIGRGMFSHNGTVGMQMRKAQAFDYVWPDRGLLVMYSDGLLSRWSLASYPGLQTRHPAIIAAILSRDFKRGRDDMTVRLQN